MKQLVKGDGAVDPPGQGRSAVACLARESLHGSNAAEHKAKRPRGV